MSDLTVSEYAEVDGVIRSPFLLNKTLHRNQTSKWTLEMFDRAEIAIPHRSPAGLAPACIEEMRELRAERKNQLEEERRLESERASREATRQLHNDLLEALKKPTVHPPAINVTGSQVMIGHHNVQLNQIAAPQGIVAQIDASTAPASDKVVAKGLLAKFLEHPLTASVVGGMSSAVFGPK